MNKTTNEIRTIEMQILCERRATLKEAEEKSLHTKIGVAISRREIAAAIKEINRQISDLVKLGIKESEVSEKEPENAS